MASVIGDILDRLVALAEGTHSQSRTFRSIDAGRFVHVDFAADDAFPQSIEPPYPFDLRVGETGNPEDGPVTLASNQIWSRVSVEMRILYAEFPDDEYERRKAILEDVYRLRRTISDTNSWDSLTGFSGVTIGEAATDVVRLTGDDNDTEDFAHMLTLDLVFVYREDYTS